VEGGNLGLINKNVVGSKGGRLVTQGIAGVENQNDPTHSGNSPTAPAFTLCNGGGGGRPLRRRGNPKIKSNLLPW